MNRSWSDMKQIISTYDQREGVFLSLIDQDGFIRCANATMMKALHLRDPRTFKTNFIDLLHPVNQAEFRKVIRDSGDQAGAVSAELYLKNGYYHPMKWQVNPLIKEEGTFLCVGHKLVDDKRAEQFNQLGEKNYQLIMEGMNAGILFQDGKGELIAANQKAADLFGTTLERLYQLKDIGLLWDKQWVVSNEKNEPVMFRQTPFMRAIESGTLQQQLLNIRLHNGDERWIFFSSQPLSSEAHSLPYAVVTNITDITEEKKLIRQLKERKMLFKTFMNQSPNLAWVVDDQGRLVFANSAYLAFFGIKEEESLGQRLMDLVPPGVVKALYPRHVDVLESDEPLELVQKFKWADGSEFIFHIDLFPITTFPGRKMIGGQAVNLADKYNAERLLKEARERLNHIARATTDAIWEWDMQDGSIFRNEALQEMIGAAPARSQGLSWWLRRIHMDDRKKVRRKLKKVMDDKLHSWEDDYRFLCADGSYRHIHSRGFLTYESDLPVKMIASLQDVTGLKELEDQLLNIKLQQQKEISEIMVRVQKKERTRIGHELHDNVNQILSSAKLFVDMIPAGEGQDQMFKKKSLDYIMMAIEEIRKLSRELVVPQLQGKGLADSIKGLVEDIRLSGALQIEFRCDKRIEELSGGKKVTIFRIIQEQCKNILKYSKATQATISLFSPDEYAELSVSDNGIGFNPQQTPQGIGLSNIYERTRYYSGTVSIRTAPGEGCSLDVRIPVLD